MTFSKTKWTRRLFFKRSNLFTNILKNNHLEKGTFSSINTNDDLQSKKASLTSFCNSINMILLKNTLMKFPHSIEHPVNPEYVKCIQSRVYHTTSKIDTLKVERTECKPTSISIEDIRDIDAFAHFLNSYSFNSLSKGKGQYKRSIPKIGWYPIGNFQNNFDEIQEVLGDDIQNNFDLQNNFDDLQNNFDLQKDIQFHHMKYSKKKHQKSKIDKIEDSEISLEMNFEDKIIGVVDTSESEKSSLSDEINKTTRKYKIKASEYRNNNSFINKRRLSPSKWSVQTSNRRLQIEKESLEEEKEYKDIVARSKLYKKQYKAVLVMNEFKHYDDLVIKASKIHGLGIFTPIEIPANTLLMEYKGEIIGKCVSDKREKLYKKHNIESVYMFSVSEDMIIDATMTGNKARYINHSCDPNCEAINSTVDKAIKYCTIRDIQVGEELTINYNMSQEPIEEVCNCGKASCRSKNK